MCCRAWGVHGITGSFTLQSAAEGFSLGSHSLTCSLSYSYFSKALVRHCQGSSCRNSRSGNPVAQVYFLLPPLFVVVPLAIYGVVLLIMRIKNGKPIAEPRPHTRASIASMAATTASASSRSLRNRAHRIQLADNKRDSVTVNNPLVATSYGSKHSPIAVRTTVVVKRRLSELLRCLALQPSQPFMFCFTYGYYCGCLSGGGPAVKVCIIVLMFLFYSRICREALSIFHVHPTGLRLSSSSTETQYFLVNDFSVSTYSPLYDVRSHC